MKRTVLAVIILMLVTGCTPKSAPIRIGFAASLTGRDSSLGIEEREAALMAVEDVNASGGINGRRVELVVRDDRNDPEYAIAADRELVENEGVVAVLGHATSTLSKAALPYINSTDVVFVSPTTSSPYFEGMDDNFFRLEQSIDLECAYLAEYALSRGITSFAGILDSHNRVYSEPWYKAFAEEVEEGGGSIAPAIVFNSNTANDYLRLVERLFKENPQTDGVIIVAGALDTALIAQQVRKLSSDAVLISSGWARTDDLLTTGGQAVEGMLFSLTFDDDSQTPSYVAFRDAFVERYGHRPSFAAAHAYEAMFFIFEGIETQQPGESLKDSLLRIRRIEGLQEEIIMDEYGDATRPIFVLTVSEGQFTLVEQ